MQLWGFEKQLMSSKMIGSRFGFLVGGPGAVAPPVRAVASPSDSGGSGISQADLDFLRATFPTLNFPDNISNAAALTTAAQSARANLTGLRSEVKTRAQNLLNRILGETTPSVDVPPLATTVSTPNTIPTTQAYDNYQRALTTAQGELRASRHNDYALLTRAYEATGRTAPVISDLSDSDAYGGAIVGMTQDLGSNITPEQRGQLERLQTSLGRNELRRERLATVVYNATHGVQPNASDNLLEEKTRDLNGTHVESDTSRSAAESGDVPAPPRAEGADAASQANNANNRPNGAAQVIGSIMGPVASVAGAIGQIAILAGASAAQAAQRANQAAQQSVAMVAAGYAQASVQANQMGQAMMLELQRMGQQNMANQMAFVVAMRPQHPRVSLGAMTEEILPNSPTRPSSLSESSRV
ncbi:MAG: hypothetical protein IPJ69_10120 [Deltaproteobacteria bacterium]|nr:MAG: hypothetical protein IPJ69_10120 [Deltaproteobacteria bacterium]